jgi:tetratricopeptide (TPR) repeat protein/predicted regulator of Ras-like GTPase activity (Roadblock/LC7/MglB family)
MSLPPLLQGLSEIKGALTVDPTGRLIAAEPPSAGHADDAAAIAVVVSGFSAAGTSAKLGRLSTLLVKGAGSSSVTAVRPDALLVVTVDPATTTHQVERALKDWKPDGSSAAATAPRAAPATPRAPTPPKPLPTPAATAPRSPVATFAPRAASARPAADPWGSLRRSLGRGQLTEAVAYQRQLVTAGDPERYGSECVSTEECDRAVRALLEGIGSVMAGDGVGGGRILAPLVAESQENLSFRWLALLWIARADLKSGAIPAARAHIQEALTTARQLDIEARALSQWIAADVLAQDGDSTRALAWLAESRSRFEKTGDRWGMGQTWLSEARVLTSGKREPQAAEAAQQAAAFLPDSEEPSIALARLAVIRDDHATADRILRPLRTQSAERVRALVAAIKGGLVTRADAGEFLREQDAPPSERALRSLERIAKASPRFAQAREALAWMLLRVGRYDDAGAVFRGLLASSLAPGDRASVMLGLGCIANAQGGGAPVAAAAPAAAADDLPALPPLSTSALLARATQGAGAGSVFSGQLSSFALPDLLEFLRTGKRTGLLVCSSASGMGALRFRDGLITGAASPAAPGVGELLVRARKVAPDALRALSASLGPDQPDHLVGERLVRDGLADAASVKAAFAQLIGVAVRELMHWTDGEFTFNRETQLAPESAGLSVALDPQGLLLNFFKELDEASRDAASP